MNNLATTLFCLLAGVGLALAQAPAQAPAQPADVVFRSDVMLVRVDAQVRDRSNRVVAGLRAEDFVLREQGRVREIRNFAREDMAMDVLLLLDVSGSMRTHVERIASAAHTAFQSLGPDDRVAIMVFDRQTRVQMPFKAHRTGDVERGFDKVLDRENFNGGTDITHGIYNAIDYVRQNARREARRAIVILTDDQTELNSDEMGLIRMLSRNDIVLSLLLAPDAAQYQRRTGGGGGGQGWPGGGGRRGGGGGLPGVIWGGGGGMGGPRMPGGSGGGRSGGPVILGGRGTHSAGTGNVAEQSGGDSMSVDQASALEDTLARLRQRYALHFYLPEGARAGQERDVEVILSSAARSRYPEADIRYRRTYVAPESNGSTPAEVTGTSNPDRPSSSPSTAESVDSGSGPVVQPRARRRVSDPNAGSGAGPMVDRSDPASGWPKAGEAAQPKVEAEKPRVGWPKAK